jgi:hypothetical protein
VENLISFTLIYSAYNNSGKVMKNIHEKRKFLKDKTLLEPRRRCSYSLFTYKVYNKRLLFDRPFHLTNYSGHN